MASASTGQDKIGTWPGVPALAEHLNTESLTEDVVPSVPLSTSTQPAAKHLKRYLEDLDRLQRETVSLRQSSPDPIVASVKVCLPLDSTISISSSRDICYEGNQILYMISC